MLVDDSVVVRRSVAAALSEDGEIESVHTAASGRTALAKIGRSRPDVVVLDIEMPETNGLDVLAQLRQQYPGLPVIMFSALTERGATATLDALALGAADYVPKPSGAQDARQAMDVVRAQLLPKIKALGAATTPGPKSVVRGSANSVLRFAEPREIRADAVVIAASTGGPDAISRFLDQLPSELSVPVVIAQHMPALFTPLFARRMNRRIAARVREASAGDAVEPGVWIAPGGSHLALERAAGRVEFRTSDAVSEHMCRPSADVLFRAAAQVYGSNLLAVVLTGMGSDGLKGCVEIAKRGGRVLAQDDESSVVWGMPGQVSGAGLAEMLLPPAPLGAEVARVLRSREAGSHVR
ncbi:MAG: chemotaxis-specific protein-glutamate methyltransferase CheB [Planctomycetota bacterium]|jgi:two-component system chemotaxis response regulator CheB